MVRECEYMKSILKETVFHNFKSNTVSDVLLESFPVIYNRIANNQSRKLVTGLFVFETRQKTPIDVLQRICGINIVVNKDKLGQVERFNLGDIDTSYREQARHYIIVHAMHIVIINQLVEKEDVSLKDTSRKVLFPYVIDYQPELPTSDLYDQNGTNARRPQRIELLRES